MCKYIRSLAAVFTVLILIGSRVVAASSPAPRDFARMIMTLELPDPETQEGPSPLWVRPDTGILMEFPVPVLDVQGRGFRILRSGEKDSAEVEAEWVVIPHRVPPEAKSVEEIPGPYTVFAMPHVDSSYRVLHITLTDGKVYSFLLQTPLRASVEGKGGKEGVKQELAVARVRFRYPRARRDERSDGSSPAAADTVGQSQDVAPDSPEATGVPRISSARVHRTELVPEATLRESTPETEGGMIDFQRMLIALPRDRAVAAAAQSDVFESQERDQVYRFGDFELRVVWVVRDTTSNAIALTVMARNCTLDKIALDATKWAVRVGDALYAPTLVKGGMEIAPGASCPVFLVIGRDLVNGGKPLRLAVSNEFQPSTQIAGRASARPFESYNIPLQ